MNGDRWPDDIGLSDIENRFVCTACGKQRCLQACQLQASPHLFMPQNIPSRRCPHRRVAGSSNEMASTTPVRSSAWGRAARLFTGLVYSGGAYTPFNNPDPTAINDLGQIVGLYVDSNGVVGAFERRLIPLKPSIWANLILG